MAKLPPPRVSIPEGTPRQRCMACDAVIFFVKTASGKAMPVEVDGAPHFVTCPEAATFRGKTRKQVLAERQGALFDAPAKGGKS